MRAIGVRTFGPPSKLEFLEVPEPVVIGPEDIIVAVRAVGLNPGDPIRAAGWSRLLETVKFVNVPFPLSSLSLSQSSDGPLSRFITILLTPPPLRLRLFFAAILSRR